MAEIPAKKFAGAMMILLPIIFWLTMYLRFDCQSGGSCSLKFNWLIIGFFVILFGLFVLLSVKEGDKSQDGEVVDVVNDENASKKKKV